MHFELVGKTKVALRKYLHIDTRKPIIIASCNNICVFDIALLQNVAGNNCFNTSREMVVNYIFPLPFKS